jgi:putative tributyrin esterase
MALARVDFFSDALGLSTSMSVILPQEAKTQIGLSSTRPEGDVPVLYLLHGMSDDDTTWSRRTSVERYVAELGIAVVMPQVHRSFYTDQVHGLPFWTFLSEELPHLVGQMFRVSGARADTFVAGLSMGGYGAMKWALREPWRFAAAASLSGALALGDRDTVREEVRRDHEIAFGARPVTGTDDDVLHLLGAADPDQLPALYVACGSEDFLHRHTLDFLEVADRRGIPVTTHLGPGDHEWQYWDDRIRDVLAWLPITR